MLRFDPEKHEYFWHEKQVPCVSNIIECAGNFLVPLRDFGDAEKMAHWHALHKMVEVKAGFGSTIHLYLEMSDNGTLDPDRAKWDERAVPYVDAWQRFREQYQLTTNPIIEEMFYDKELGVAGRRDRRWPGVVCEIKTSEPNDVAGLQLAGYAHPLPDAENQRLMACFLSSKGSYKVREYSYKKYLNLYKCAYTLYNFKHGGR